MKPEPSAEALDFIAYLERRRENFETMAATKYGFADDASVMLRQFTVIMDDVRAGLHHGEADVRAQILAARAEREEAAK